MINDTKYKNNINMFLYLQYNDIILKRKKHY